MKCNITFRRKENCQGSDLWVVVLFLFFFFVITPQILAQDSIPIAKDLTEEKELEFQQFFFSKHFLKNLLGIIKVPSSF